MAAAGAKGNYAAREVDPGVTHGELRRGLPVEGGDAVRGPSVDGEVSFPAGATAGGDAKSNAEGDAAGGDAAGSDRSLAASGKVTSNREPWPGPPLEASMWPPCSCTMR